MLTLLKQFAALSLASGALMTLIPEGSIRKTASMVVGLLMLLCWSDGILQLLDRASTVGHASSPQTALTATGYDAAAAWSTTTQDTPRQMEAGL